MADVDSAATAASQAADYPTGLVAQFRRNLTLYLLGALLLAGQQILMAKRDFQVKAAIDAVLARRGLGGGPRRAHPAVS